jgi:hypothetical protein
MHGVYGLEPETVLGFKDAAAHQQILAQGQDERRFQVHHVGQGINHFVVNPATATLGRANACAASALHRDEEACSRGS